jgi:hypothetical protein
VSSWLALQAAKGSLETAENTLRSTPQLVDKI